MSETDKALRVRADKLTGTQVLEIAADLLRKAEELNREIQNAKLAEDETTTARQHEPSVE